MRYFSLLPFHKITLAVLLGLLCMGLGKSRLEAHGYIVRSIPEDRAVLDRSPNRVQIWFSEGLEPEFSTIAVYDQAGQQIDLGDGGVDPRNSGKLVASLPNNLPTGAYLIRLRPVYVNDGHAVNDTMVFWIGDPTGHINTGSASDRALIGEVLWRAILQLSLLLYAGGVVTYAVVLRPAWGRPDLSKPLLWRIHLLLWCSLILAILSNLAALFQLSISLFQTDLATVLRDELWNVALLGTNVGQVWQYRMSVLVAMLFIQIIATQQAQNRPASRHILWLLNGLLAILALVTISLISHAAGSELWREVSVLADYLHLVSVAVWVGGLLMMLLLLRPALSPLSPSQRGQALQSVLSRFSALAALSVGLIISTGVYSSSMRLDSPSVVTTSTYGITLASKVILTLPLLGLGLVHHLTLYPHHAAQLAAWLNMPKRWATLPQTLRLEGLFAILVIFAAAWLPATPPPEPAQARREVTVTPYEIAVEGYKLALSINPGAVGANSYDIALTDAMGIPLVIDEVQLRFSDPASGRYTLPLPLEQAGMNLWVGASGDLDQAVEWDALIDFSGPSIAPTRAAIPIMVHLEVVDANPRRATWLNWLSAASILGFLLAGVWPFIRHWTQQGKWDSMTLGMGLASLATLALLIGGGIWYFERTSQQVQEQRSTPPELVNPTLADQTSILSGRTLYEARCLMCHGDSGNPYPPFADGFSRITPQLITVLAEYDDAYLFRILSSGIVNRHRYGDDLTESQRWDLINFLRTFE